MVKFSLAEIFCIVLGLAEISYSQSGNFSTNSNFRIKPDTVLQVETRIAAHPHNNQIIAGTAVTDIYPGGYTTGAYITTNGGVNWNCTNAIKNQQGGIITTVGNSSIMIDKDGTMMILYIAPTNHINGSGFKVGVSRSTNNGLFWSPTIYVPGVAAADKPDCATDFNVASPYYGRSYIAYSEADGIYFSYTTNSGLNWSNVKKISPNVADSRVGVSIEVGMSGEIYASWPYLYESLKYVGFAKSTNGGLTWDSTDKAFQSYPTPFGYRVNLNLVKLNGLPVMAVDNSGGPRNGWIYIASSEMRDINSPATDDCDIVIRRSTDRGETWTEKFRVNQSISGVLKYQLFPAMCVDKNGTVNITYIDTRNTPTNDSFEVYNSYSINGGETFTDQMISDHKFKYKQLSADKRLFGFPGYIGASIGVASAGNGVWSFWFDNFFEEYQGWLYKSESKPWSHIKVIPQGFYNSDNNSLNSKDTIYVYLRNNLQPYDKIDSARGALDSLSCFANVFFENSIEGDYYLEVTKRNSIGTWSRLPVHYSADSGLSYDFTVSADQAYGNNMIQVNNKWCTYSCDINRDAFVDLSDIISIHNDASAFRNGYLPTDANGDWIVDVSDIILSFNNANSFVNQVNP